MARNMRKKKLALGKWVLLAVVVVLLGLGYWLSLEREAPVAPVQTPVELKLTPAS